MSGMWDREEAGSLRRDAVRQAPRRDLRLPPAHAARAGARGRPDPGRVHQGLQELRDAREARERARLALPDRPPRRARRDPPAQDHPVPPVDRRVARVRAVGRAPGHGRPPLRRHAARAGPHPRAPAGRPPARRAPRPHRPRARGRARRQPRRGARAPDPRAREPPPGARRRTRRRGRGRSDARRLATRRRVTDEPRPRLRRRAGPAAVAARARPDASRPSDSTAPLEPDGRRLARRAPRRLRVAAGRSPTPTTPTVSRCAACATSRPSRRATCGRAPPPRSRRESAARRGRHGAALRPAGRSLPALGRPVRARRRRRRHRRQRPVGRVPRPDARRDTPGGTPADRRSRPAAPTPAPTPIAVGAGAVDWLGTRRDGALAYNVDRRSTRSARPTPARLRTRRRSQFEAGRPRRSGRSRLPVAGRRTGGRRRHRRDRRDAGPRGRPPDARADPTPTSPVPSTPTPATATPEPRTAPSRPRRRSPSDRARRARRRRRPLHRADVDRRRPDRPPAVEPPSTSAEPTPAATPIDVDRRRADRGERPGDHRPASRSSAQSAAYSPDGAWFAFTARPSDGSAGPDIYVWRVGDQLAERGPRATTPASSHRGPGDRRSMAGDRSRGRRRPTAVVLHSIRQRRARPAIDAERLATGRRPGTRTGRCTWDGHRGRSAQRRH